jgi:hypothetical protein
MSTLVVQKPRSRVITGWRHVPPAPRGPRRKKPIPTPPPERQKDA